MRKIDSVTDQMRGIATYELAGGKRVQLDSQAVRDHGAANLIRDIGHGDLLPTERVPVIFHGRVVGTMSPYFDPTNIKSQSFFYDPRPGDFTRGIADGGQCNEQQPHAPSQESK